MASSKPLHSCNVLNDVRDTYWHDDFLGLVVERGKLKGSRRILDVGCGHGHWGLRLLLLLSEGAEMDGVDIEAPWVAEAHRRADALSLGRRCRFHQGSAEQLPFADNRFDLITCQTLLMHLAEPERALDEMRRVLAPGGSLLLAEPANLSNLFAMDSVDRELPAAQVAARAEFVLTCSRGRRKLGRGDDSIATELPRLLADRGFVCQVFQDDRVNTIMPPYSREAREALQLELGFRSRGFWLWNEEDATRMFRAGGGDLSRFPQLYAAFLSMSDLFEAQVRAGTYSRLGHAAHFLFLAT